MQTAIIVPTYNERENLGALVDQILELSLPLAVFIVDDHSPDGTGDLADTLAQQWANVFVIHRPAKLGLGTAHIAGMRAALADDFRYIMTMDADFSHHPSYIPLLIEACQEYDVAIGSRYVPGGGIRDCRLRRRILSWVANRVVQQVLGMGVEDCTAGFRCYRRYVLEQIELDAIVSEGYSFLIEILYHAHRLGFQMGEVPIIFNNRWQGRSKISAAEIWKAMGTVWRLGWEKRRFPWQETQEEEAEVIVGWKD